MEVPHTNLNESNSGFFSNMILKLIKDKTETIQYTVQGKFYTCMYSR